MRPARPARALALLPVLALAACQTPGEACLAPASRQLAIVDGLIRETQGNLQRGFAVERDQEVRVLPDICWDDDDDDDHDDFFCERTVVRDVARPVAVDLDEEQRQLDQLLERRPALLAEWEARAQACAQAYPAG